MGNNIQTFEVRVEVKKKGSMHFSAHVGMYIENKITKMFHIDARTQEQAIHRCKKYGRPISCRKFDVDRIHPTGKMLVGSRALSNPYPSSVAMDEFIWQSKNKRAGRLGNRARDKADS